MLSSVKMTVITVADDVLQGLADGSDMVLVVNWACHHGSRACNLRLTFGQRKMP